jgi:WD40 repeat protein
MIKCIQVRRWESTTTDATFTTTDIGTCVAAHKDRIFVGQNSGYIEVFDFKGLPITSLSVKSKCRIVSLRIIDNMIIANGTSCFKVWDVNTLQELNETEQDFQSIPVEVDSSNIYVSKSTDLQIYDRRGFYLVQTLSFDCAPNCVRVVGDELLQNQENDINFWDLRKNKMFKTLKSKHHESPLRYGFEYDGNNLFVCHGYWKPKVTVLEAWNKDTGEVIHDFSPHMKQCNSYTNMDPLRLVAGSNGDGDLCGIQLFDFS